MDGMNRNSNFRYETAFERNLGLIDEEEQARLREARIAIIGLGGAGSAGALILARLGVGRFTLADPDRYELSNFNRQLVAGLRTLGANKAEATAEAVLNINPEADVRVMTDPVGEDNLETFLDGVDVVIDALDVFSPNARRLLSNRARDAGIPVVSAGPIGFGTVWYVLTPESMSYDEFFGIRDGMSPRDQVVRFLVGVAGQGPHLRYMNLKRVNSRSGAAPSLAVGSHLLSSAQAAEVLKLLLGRGRLLPAPWLHHIDFYTYHYRRYRRPLGGRDPLFALKVWVFSRRLTSVREFDQP